MIEKTTRSLSSNTALMLLTFYLILDVNARTEKNSSLIYILLWLSPKWSPSWNKDLWQQHFFKRKCHFSNCVIVTDHDYFSDVRDYDVLIFNSWTLWNFWKPKNRTHTQKYIFMSEESPGLSPIPDLMFDRFFNLTWTYKLDSDIALNFVTVKSKKGEVIGPKINMHWKSFSRMKPTNRYIKSKLQSKKKAAVWFVSQCQSASKREKYVLKLKRELRKYNLTVDIYGDCGNLKCPMSSEECHALVEKDYYFYLAFENALCEDYVTDKVLTATKHFAIPIVYGAANYSRFLPPGSYLNAYALGPKRLARSMNNIINEKKRFYDFFRWHHYYSFHAPSETAQTDELCTFCAYLNNDHNKNVYNNISNFWSCHSNG